MYGRANTFFEVMYYISSISRASRMQEAFDALEYMDRSLPQKNRCEIGNMVVLLRQGRWKD